MKKILMALAMMGLTYCCAEAQTDIKRNCEVVQNKVCRKGGDCYKTRYAENFKVCKNDNGYFICCETENYNNSTHPAFVVTNTPETTPETNYYAPEENYAQNDAVNAITNGQVPESQSYVGYNIISSNSYNGYYFQRGKTKACYVGDNVAEDDRAPYQGCPSPQDDGPAKNNYRNLNVVTQ